MGFHLKSFKASAALVRGRAVVLGGSAELTYPLATGGQVLGILATNTAHDAMGDVYLLGDCPIAEADEVIAIGDLLKASITTGKLAVAAASVTLDCSNALSDVSLVAKKAYQGIAGNLISITLADPGVQNQALACTVSGFDITVNLATGADPGHAITSTGAEVAAIINATAAAALLVTADDEGAGTGVVNAKAKTYLRGGEGAFARAMKAATADGDYIAVDIIGGAS